MNRAAAILATLAGRGIELALAGDQIQARPGHRLTDDDARLIRQHKRSLIHLLTTRAEADETGRHAASEAPRELTPKEKADVARLCRHEYQAKDEEIADTISEAEANPAYRGYLAVLAKASEGRQ